MKATTSHGSFTALRLIAAAVVLCLASAAAAAQTAVYHIRGNAAAGSNNIWVVDTTTGTERLVYTGYPGGNAATLAQRPSDGMIFYAINAAGGSNGAVYRFNPATPGVAPVLLGTLGAGVGSGFRMAFSSGNVLYYMSGGGGADNDRLYTVNQTTGAATAGPNVTGTGNGGDMTFVGNTLYVINQNRQLYSATTAGGAATLVGTVTFPGGATPGTLGLAPDSAGRLLIQTQNPSTLYRITLPSLTATTFAAVGGGTTVTGDLASANVPAPNLSITKTDNATTLYRGGPVTYTVVVTNLGTYSVTGTVTDTVPAAVTGVTWTCAASSGSSCAAASGSGNSISTSATLEAGDTATYTVSGTISASAATGTLTNTATVAVPAWLTDSNTTNNSASDNSTVTLNANLGVTKTDGLASANPGQTVTYTVVVSNAGPDASVGSIFTDSVPAALSGVTWTCGSATNGAACGAPSGSGNSISTTANLPANSSVTYTITGTLSSSATGTLSNTAQILTPASGVTDPNDPSRAGANNNSATDTTTIVLVPDLAIAKSHTGDFTRGSTGTYTIAVSNTGTGATSGAVTVTDTLPAGLAPTGPVGLVNGWTCGISAQTVTCTRSNALAAGASYPNITVAVNVLQTAAASVTNTAAVSGGGDISPANNSDDDPTTIVSATDLGLTKTVNNASPGLNQQVIFTVTLTNAGPSDATNVAVSDPIPAGLTLISVNLSAGTYNNTTGVWSVGGLASGASATMEIIARVTAPGTITNTAQVSASDQPDPDSTPNNNNPAEDDQASAALNVAAPPHVALCKTFPGQSCDPPPSLPPQLPGAEITYVIQFANTGGSAAQSFYITDPVPASTDFKVGSAGASLGTTGLAVAFHYSYDNGANFVATPPTSGGGGAPAGYDRTVTHVRWVFTGSLSHAAPNNAGSVQFTTRIR